MKLKNQNGNALWFILIAIGLMGLLTVMMSRSASNTDETGRFERTTLLANEILGYAKTIENAVQLVLSQGCGENTISFDNDVIAGYTNLDSPSDYSCHIFESSGGGLSWLTPKDSWFEGASADFVISGANTVIGINNDTRAELIIELSGLSDDVCLAINRAVGVTNPSGALPEDPAINEGQLFTGAYQDPPANAGEAIEDTATGSILRGEQTGCFYETAGDKNIFYHVLISR